jgi:hypothetical protein
VAGTLTTVAWSAGVFGRREKIATSKIKTSSDQERKRRRDMDFRKFGQEVIGTVMDVRPGVGV